MAQRATSLGPEPSSLFLWLVLFSLYFCFLLVFRRNTCFLPPQKASFQHLPSFLPSFMFNFPFSLSLSLFLCLSLSLIVFFIASFFSFFFAWFSCLIFVSVFLCLVSLLFVSWKKQYQIIKSESLFSSIPSVFWGLVSCLVFSFKPLFLIFVVFLILSCALCSTSMFLLSQKTTYKTPILVKRGGCNIFLNNLCFAKCEELSFFLPISRQNWSMFKNSVKLVFQHILKRKTPPPPKTFLKGYCLVQVRVIVWSKFGLF